MWMHISTSWGKVREVVQGSGVRLHNLRTSKQCNPK